MKRLALFICLLTIGMESIAQSRPWFVGVQPGITKEKFYMENEFDMNVIPIVVQTPLTKRFDLRQVTLVNYHFGEQNRFSDIGINVIAPYTFRTKENILDRTYGFYLGPMIGVSRNNLNMHNTLNLAGELGYMFEASKRFTLSLGVQYGRTYFDYDRSPGVWREHLALTKINLGFWVGD